MRATSAYTVLEVSSNCDIISIKKEMNGELGCTGKSVAKDQALNGGSSSKYDYHHDQIHTNQDHSQNKNDQGECNAACRRYKKVII